MLHLFWKERKNNFSEISCQIQDAIVEETNTRMHFTEIHEGGLYFCSEQRKVTVCGQEIDLTAKEFDALHLLITNRKRIMTFETISCQVWGEEYIVSIRGVRYKFEP